MKSDSKIINVQASSWS